MATVSSPRIVGVSGLAGSARTGFELASRIQSSRVSFVGKWEGLECHGASGQARRAGKGISCSSLHTKGSGETTQEEKETNAANAVAVKPVSEQPRPASDAAGSALDNIEKRAQKSIDKLKHILYKLKSRPVVDEGVDGIPTNANARDALPSLQDEREVYVSHKLHVDLSSNGNDSHTVVKSIVHEAEEKLSAEAEPAKKMYRDDFTHFDSLTCTRTTVQFDEKSQTAVVTVTATVRAAELETHNASTERTVAMAARALTRTCLNFEKKMHSELSGLIEKDESRILSRKNERLILEHLSKGKLVSFVPIQLSSGETAFRPMHKLTLSYKGKNMVAIYKPIIPGDVYGRFQQTHPEWVAYRLSSLLGNTMVPPCVMRKSLKISDRKFPPGIVTLFVEDVKPLSTLPLKDWRDAPEIVVSNGHILDALLGNAPREEQYFFAGRDWSDTEQSRPILLSHPVGPGHGELHSMWSSRGSSAGIRTVAPETLISLKNLQFESLVEAFGGVLNAQEMNLILERKKQVLAYFECMQAKNAKSNGNTTESTTECMLSS